MTLSNEKLIELYEWMVWDRMLDEKTNELFRMGKIMSMYHSGQGQEAASIGSYYALQEGDAFIPSHRGKAHYMMRGADLNRFMAGMFGRKEGMGQGRNPVGSHMTGDCSLGMLPTQGSVGSSFNMAVGAALAFKIKNEKRAVLVNFGDGGSNRGDVHEGMNFAAVFKLPAVFYCINNGWSLSVRASYGLSVEDVSVRASGYGIPGLTIDGRDVLQVYEAVSQALERARAGQGPSLIEAKVSRWTAHSANDPDLYRTDEERAEARRIDPLEVFEKVLEEKDLLKEDKKNAIRSRIRESILSAIEYAEGCNEPDIGDLMHGVYKED